MQLRKNMAGELLPNCVDITELDRLVFGPDVSLCAVKSLLGYDDSMNE